MKIDPPAWIHTKAVNRLFEAIPDGKNCLRFVGGCVRDFLAGAPVVDIDLATPLQPDVLKKYLHEAGIKTIDTGIKHGTITALINQSTYEITTLRRDIETDGRHAVIEYTDDWLEDSKRRDFTINALYLSKDGTLYDFHNGMIDLKEGNVRFIGDANKRITEDFLRILRFFRFWIRYGKGFVDKSTIKNLTLNAGGLDGISGERLRSECWRIFEHPRCLEALQLMTETKILQVLFNLKSLPNALIQLLNNSEPTVHENNALSIFANLALLDTSKLAGLCSRFKCSNNERSWMINFIKALQKYDDIHQLNYVLYYYGPELARQWLVQKDLVSQETIQIISNWSKPHFPLDGRDLQASGVQAGPVLGRLLDILRDTWIESEFKLSKETMIQITEMAIKNNPEFHKD